MTEPTKDVYDQRAEELLPIDLTWSRGIEAIEDYVLDHRPAVAAKLREDGKERDDLVSDLYHREDEIAALVLKIEEQASRIKALEEALAEQQKPLLSESDLIEFYKQQMKEHRDQAITNRKRVEALEEALTACDSLICAIDNHTLGCECECYICKRRFRTRAALEGK